MQKPILLTAIILVFSGCAALMGIKEPKTETTASLYKYYDKHKIDTALVVFMQPIYVDSMTQKSYKPGWDKGFRPLQFMYFDSTGSQALHLASCEGTLKRTKVLEKYPPINNFAIDSSYSVYQELALLDNTAKHINHVSGATLVIYSQVYTGWLGRVYVKKLLRYGKKNSIENVYLVNTDDR